MRSAENKPNPLAFHCAMRAVPSPWGRGSEMRGNGAANYPLYRSIPRTVELGEFSDNAGGFSK